MFIERIIADMIVLFKLANLGLQVARLKFQYVTIEYIHYTS
jgi:hypothetical protein